MFEAVLLKCRCFSFSLQCFFNHGGSLLDRSEPPFRVVHRGEKMESKAKMKSPRMIMLSGRFYVVDCRLQRFQQVLNPSDYISFDSSEGQKLCAEFGVARSVSEQQAAEVQG